MSIYLLAGVAIGVFINDWLGRVLIAGLMGVFDCVSLAYGRWRRPSHRRLAREMRKAGVSESEIQEVTDPTSKLNEEGFAEPRIAR